MSENSLSLVASRLRFFLAGYGFEGNPSPAIQVAVESLDANVDAIIARQIWNSQAPDHGNTAGKTLELFSTEIGYSGTYLLAPLDLARAYCCPFSRHYQSPKVLTRLTASLQFFSPFIRPDATRQGNWYAWDIAIPRWLSQVLILSGEYLPPQLRAELIASLCALPFMLYASDIETGARRTASQVMGAGANTMEILLILLMRAALTGERAWADAATKHLPEAMQIGQAEGVQHDGSFHFHGHGVNASYGHVCVATQGLWLYLTQGTPWQCPPDELSNHLKSLCGFFCLNAWRGRFAPHTLDRSIASPRGIYGEISGGSDYLQGLLFTLQSGCDDGDRHALAIALVDWLNGRAADVAAGVRAPLDLSTLLLKTQVFCGDPDDKSLLSGTRYYPESEYLLVRRANWFAAVLTSSPHTSGWKSILGAHSQGASSAEFSLALMSDGCEYTNSTVPTMNWRRLMNVTRCDAVEAAPEGYGQSTFVGGLTQDNCAVQAMQYLLAPPQQGTLRANKSLFVTPDSLVLLGTEIFCDAPSPVATTLLHAPLVDGAVYLHNSQELDASIDGMIDLQAGDTLYLRNLAFKVLTPSRLTIETREASYASMHREETYDRMGEEFFHASRTHWIYVTVEHGVQPRGESYGAVIWPDVAPEFVPNAEPEIQCDGFHHAVKSRDGKSGGEVRFPGDWRVQRGLSQYAAESAQWGSLSLWKPAGQGDKCDLKITSPLRSLRQPNHGTEIFLPDNLVVSPSATFNMPDVTTLGTPWPRHILALMANGAVHEIKALYI